MPISAQVLLLLTSKPCPFSKSSRSLHFRPPYSWYSAAMVEILLSVSADAEENIWNSLPSQSTLRKSQREKPHCENRWSSAMHGTRSVPNTDSLPTHSG